MIRRKTFRHCALQNVIKFRHLFKLHVLKILKSILENLKQNVPCMNQLRVHRKKHKHCIFWNTSNILKCTYKHTLYLDMGYFLSAKTKTPAPTSSNSKPITKDGIVEANTIYTQSLPPKDTKLTGTKLLILVLGCLKCRFSYS